MTKIKTYVLIVSEKFPAYHSRAGEDTGFVDSILNGTKIHTIRSNAELWRDRIAKVKEGKAVVSIRVWTGKPYRSKQREILRLDKDSGIDTQEVSIYKGFGTVVTVCYYTTVWGSEYISTHRIEDVAKNDGLSTADFIEWFEDADEFTNANEGIIIHFTKFRY